MGPLTAVTWLLAALVTPSVRLGTRGANSGCSKQKQNKNRARLCKGKRSPEPHVPLRKPSRPAVLRDEEGGGALRKEVRTRQGTFGHIQAGGRALFLPSASGSARRARMFTQLGWQVCWQRRSLLGGTQGPSGALRPAPMRPSPVFLAVFPGLAACSWS